jgi:hypothetical protein
MQVRLEQAAEALSSSAQKQKQEMRQVLETAAKEAEAVRTGQCVLRHSWSGVRELLSTLRVDMMCACGLRQLWHYEWKKTKRR